MKKRIIALLLTICLCTIGCKPNESKLKEVAYSGGPDIQVKNEATGGFLYLNESAEEYMLWLLNTKDWTYGNTDNSNNYTLYCKIRGSGNLDIYYSSELGVFNDTDNKRYVALSDEEREKVNSLLVNDVVYRTPKFITVQYVNDETGSIRMLTDSAEKIILDILNNSKNWSDNITQVNSDMILNLDGQKIHYSSEKGIFNDLQNRRSLDLGKNEYINTLIGLAVDIKNMSYNSPFVMVGPSMETLNEEDATELLSIMNSVEWTMGQRSFDMSIYFLMHNEIVYYYPYDGIFYDDNNERYVYLTTEQKDYINALLYKYDVCGTWYEP